MTGLPRIGVAAVAVLALACSSSIPRANETLRAVPLTSSVDLDAHAMADAAGDQLDLWCIDALKVRESGGALADDSPILDGSASEQIERLHEAAAAAQGAELKAVLEAFAAAHEKRLAVMASGPKFRSKRFLEADREVDELSFGLRRWRLQR